MVKTSPLWLLVKVIAIMYAATLAKLWLRQKWRARMWCPRSQKKKQLPISKTYNSNNWLLLLILRTKEGRKSKLSRKKCSRDFFFRFTGDLSQHINALEKLRDKFGKFTDKYVIRNIFFFGFIICILFQINWINYFARKCIALHDLEIAHLYWYHKIRRKYAWNTEFATRG